MKTTKIEKETILKSFFDRLLPRLGGSEVMNDIKDIRVKKVDYTNNILAPEKVGYKIYFNLYNKSYKYSYYPNTVGFQRF